MNIAIITAGGVGTRMCSKDTPKQFLQIHGKPIIVHTIENFEKHSEVDIIIISCLEEWIDYMKKLVKTYNLHKVKSIVPGGTTGQMSIYNGLIEAKKIVNDKKNIVLIHDGVRPFLNDKVISDNITSVEKYGNAITSVDVKETVIEIDENSFIKQVPERANTRHARAPQSFVLDELLSVHKKAQSDGITNSVDSCSLMQLYGYKLHIVEGPNENIKVTSVSDFYTMRAVLTAKEDLQFYRIED